VMERSKTKSREERERRLVKAGKGERGRDVYH